MTNQKHGTNKVIKLNILVRELTVEKLLRKYFKKKNEKVIRKQLKKQKSISIINNYYNKEKKNNNTTTQKYDKYPNKISYTHSKIAKTTKM